ncbi:DUF2752 domain-containing protein [Runella sp.]|uniref:DUF2752 domain-containing protein n=1 Tax=Runella sp. TaxID=1960881 RepID=UPI003D129D13
MIKKILLTVTALALTVFYFYADPAVRSFGPPCLVRHTTGLYCWGCGGQRAFHALLHGQFGNAFRNNLLVYPVILLAGLVLYAELFNAPQAWQWIRNRYVTIISVTLFFVFTIVRNVEGFEFLLPY